MTSPITIKELDEKILEIRKRNIPEGLKEIMIPTYERWRADIIARNKKVEEIIDNNRKYFEVHNKSHQEFLDMIFDRLRDELKQALGGIS